MRLFAAFACLAFAAGAQAQAVDDPCAAEMLRCRDATCAGLAVLQNECELGAQSFLQTTCSCGEALENSSEPEPEALMDTHGGVEQRLNAGELFLEDKLSNVDALGAAIEAMEAEFMRQEEAETSQEKAVDCNGMMEGDESQTQDEGVTQQARQASLAMTPEEMATEDARLEQEEDEDKALDADVFAEELVEEVAKEMAEEMAEPQLGQGFRFRINLGRRFGPQDATPQQPQRIRFVRPSTASMANSPFNAIFNGGGADYDSPFDTGFGGFSPGSGTSLLSALFGGGMPQIPAARQQFLLGAPSFMTRRVFYPDTQSQSPVRAARFQPVTMRLATQDELHDLGLDAYGADAHAAAASLGLGYTENARRQDAVMDAVEQWKTAAGVQSTQDATQQSARAMRPLSPIRLTSAPGLAAGTGALPVVPAAPNAGSNAGADDAWYTGYRARRALYCVASIALVMAIIALNAALLMCCASACCRNFGQADSEEVFTVESVAATTPLLLEYEVERVPKPGYEHAMHAGGEEMIVVHQMAPMPREGKAAF